MFRLGAYLAFQAHTQPLNKKYGAVSHANRSEGNIICRQLGGVFH